MVKELTGYLGASLTSEGFTTLIKPILDEVTFLRELAGKIESIKPKE
ncbi:MAG: hypothetical protein WC501_00580 [Candidatus Micrarchaeia archaeon]|jgi:hypothetical protein